jgi:anaerobic C4-dicarboxylate transporter DcuA/anaerobic C4-dicarboxylate transporter DcuB
MAAMVTLTDVPPYDFELIDIIKITFPAAVVGIVLSSVLSGQMGEAPRRPARGWR